MNTANLQLKGHTDRHLLMNDLLVPKGIVDRAEVAHAMDVAEQTVLGDYPTEELEGTQRDAIEFPIRLQQLANNGASETENMPFSELAKMVGQTKGRYNDEE